jgi:hypothetical protein
MAKYLFLAMADCSDPSREDEMNKWWNEIHLPDVLSTPGAVWGSRYLNTDPEGNKRPKYLAVYEFETDDIKKTEKELNDVLTKARQAGRGTNCVVPDRSVPISRPFFMQITPVQKAPKAKKK